MKKTKKTSTKEPKKMTEEKFEKYCKDAMKAYGEIDWSERENLLEAIREAYSQVVFQSQTWVKSLEEALVCTTPGNGNYIIAHIRLEDVLAEVNILAKSLEEAYEASSIVVQSVDWNENE